jgi:hypothetical protein
MRDLLVDALAAARVTRLVTTDTFPPVKLLREWALDKVDPNPQEGQAPSSLAELIECHWCAGFWISAGVVAARRYVPGVWDPIAKAFAFSMTVGFAVANSKEEGDPKMLSKAVEKAAGSIRDGLRGVASAVEKVGISMQPVTLSEPIDASLDYVVPDHRHYIIANPPIGFDHIGGSVVRTEESGAGLPGDRDTKGT